MINSKKESKLAIADRLRNLRKKCHYTQEFLAENLSISVSSYRKKESATSGFSTEEVITLHRLYEVSCDYILLGKEEETDVIWQEIVCTNDASKLTFLLKLTEYFGGAGKVSAVFEEYPAVKMHS